MVLGEQYYLMMGDSGPAYVAQLHPQKNAPSSGIALHPAFDIILATGSYLIRKKCLR